MKRLFACALILAGASADHVGVEASDARFVSVTAGADHVCALSDRGDAYCWGSNEFGQLGSGSADSASHTKPERVSGDLKFTSVVAGFSHTCGIVRGGEA